MDRPANLGDPELDHLEPQQTLAVRIRQPMAELNLGAAYGRFLPLVRSQVDVAGGTVAGPTFGRYHQFGPDVVDVEIGMPVDGDLSAVPSLAGMAPGEVGRSELPGGHVARITHYGPYRTLPRAFAALEAWIREQPGVAEADGPWESYVDDPGAVEDRARIRTEVIIPLRDA